LGLDVYVGTLTRYTCGDWETIVQQMARQTGMTVEVIRGGPLDRPANQDEAREAVLAWRDALSKGLASHIADPLDWNEEPDAPYFTDKPAWDCYNALVLWSAYDEHRELARPENLPSDVTPDPALNASIAADFQSRYIQLLRGVELWLPCDFPFTFGAPDLSGGQIVIGSSPALLAQLRELNVRTWNAGDGQLDAWRQEGAELGAPLETSARFAFSIFTRLAEKSARHRLPMKLDY
jgi:hypothetical protein